MRSGFVVVCLVVYSVISSCFAVSFIRLFGLLICQKTSHRLTNFSAEDFSGYFEVAG